MHDTVIVFDLDGTLIDTAPDLIHATNHALGTEDLAPVAPEVLRPWIGFGGRRIIQAALENHAVVPSEAQIERLFETFLVNYAANIAVDSAPYPHLEDVLDGLTASGAVLAVCTNKREDLSRLLLDALGLSRRFAFLAGRDTFPVCKPHPDHLIGTIRGARADGRRAVMIGDSITDLSTARAAGIPFVGVSFGYTDVPMRALGPDVLIDSYRELPQALAAVLTTP
jgi:phosphoglycolate phosphatase